MRRIATFVGIALLSVVWFVRGWISRSDGVPRTSSAYFNRGLSRHEKGELDSAIGDYNEAIRLDRKNAHAYSNRGVAWHQKKDVDKAIADFDEAIRLDPKQSEIYNNRGNALLGKKEYDKAIADLNEAIGINPQYAAAYCNRGKAWREKGEFDRAVADYEESIRLDPKNAIARNASAWLYATSADARIRNGQKAVEHATHACELTDWKNEIYLDTLAAAYAEAGDFDGAAKWEAKALDTVPEKKRADYQSRLDLYKAHKPYRDEPKA
jgi:tetratricopeptide (TPR) repeat protein